MDGAVSNKLENSAAGFQQCLLTANIKESILLSKQSGG
jgi:hypothetical protein